MEKTQESVSIFSLEGGGDTPPLSSPPSIFMGLAGGQSGISLEGGGDTPPPPLSSPPSFFMGLAGGQSGISLKGGGDKIRILPALERIIVYELNKMKNRYQY